MVAEVERGREAYERQAWSDAFVLLDGAESLAADDLERLAVAAHLVGRDNDSARAWEMAYRERTRSGDTDQAARCAFWLAFALLLRGEMAPAGGWLARAERLVDDAPPDNATKGLLLLPPFLTSLGGGDHATARALAEEMVDRAERSQDDDLLALGLLSLGEALLAGGNPSRGMKLFDEAMVAVSSGEVSPVAAGIVYCAVIDACMRACDLRRAAEWTDALSGWCAAQPDLVPYRGQCLVHRSQVLLAHGAWADAISEIDRARRRLSDPVHPALGLALYQQGELHRLQGRFGDAERAYRDASAHGHEPEPGFALLRLAEGNVAAATAAVRRLLDESQARLDRPAILAAAVDVLLAAGDVDSARRAADELTQRAGAADVMLLRGMAANASGTVFLAQGDPSGALALLRDACAAWRDLGMPYDAARSRAHIGLACRALGDEDAAKLELGAALETFDGLGAAPDVKWIAELMGPPAPAPSSILTDRECEVLRLVAAGRTNREIAGVLVISEHTVARHLQNIFMKLNLSSRAAATAYAYEHGLV